MRLLLPLTSLLLATNAGAAMTYVGKPDCLIANPHPIEDEQASWSGGCKDGYADGMGTLNWSVRGRPHGGYEGVLVKGVPNGPGFLLLANDASLQGDFKEGKLEGKGVYTNAKGGKLNATFVAGVATGIADYSSPQGDTYHGEWRGNTPHGQGKMSYGAGGSYEGGWANGEFSGKGVITYPNGVEVTREFHPQPRPREPVERPSYGVRQEQPDLGTNIKHDAAYGFNVPPGLSYAQLSPEQQQLVKQPYHILLEDDEPPYPIKGPEAIAKAFMEMHAKARVRGKFRINVQIDSDGTPLSVAVLEAPEPELGRIAGSVLMLTKFKPARCGGKPCAMRYTYNTDFIIKL
ncbi:energy transducer TonB [Rugamonas apoptosis]|uniref:Energy transducer TonB n=1 Tax=Rugamonas apoptosis TaxID=2758570 RepID=A0A7W2IJC6_9BURK|nr:energy transducer TonB [Rugamonas apoptosis]MBA5686116.1 energy transducer TonB [Rugamonas apoptosis]